jgi:hypothetical protein
LDCPFFVAAASGDNVTTIPSFVIEVLWPVLQNFFGRNYSRDLETSTVVYASKK